MFYHYTISNLDQHNTGKLMSKPEQPKQENRPTVSSTQKPPRDTDPLPLRVVTESYDPSVNLDKLRRK